MTKIKVKKLDDWFSDWIRVRDNWICQRCGHLHNKHISTSKQGLHNSHYFGRAKLSTRFDPENCDSLCFACHRIWQNDDREAYRAFKINQLNETGFNMLQVKANHLIPGGKSAYWNDQLLDLEFIHLILKQSQNEYKRDWK